MRVTLCAVGRLRAGPEAELIADYLARFDRTGRALGLGPARVAEVEARAGAGREAEATLLAAAIPAGATLWVLDERGQHLTSPAFATALGQERDRSTRDLAIAIGGADGLTEALRDRATLAIAFGHMVWPHLLARVMITEQLYRATTILAGGPYHRG